MNISQVFVQESIVVREMEKPTRPQWNGSVLKTLREARGWSAKLVAAAVGANKSQVPKWESSETTPGADYLAAFSVLFGVPAMYFFAGTEQYQQFVIRSVELTGGVIPSVTPHTKEEIDEMAQSPLPGERLRARLSANRLERRGEVRDDDARDQGEQPQPPPSRPGQSPPRGR